MQAAARTILQVFVAVLLAFQVGVPAAQQNQASVATVDRLHAALLEIMRNADNLGFEGRREFIEPVILESFDFQFITRFVLGRYWSELSDAHKDGAVDVFSRWSIAQYAARFDGYSGEKFAVVSVEPARRERELVRTVLERPATTGENVTLDYLLHEIDGKWRIINVIANGVSDLSLKRADYAAVMSARGYDGLVERLNNQIAEFASGQ